MTKFKDKDKYMIYVNPNLIRKTDKIYKNFGFRSRSEFIEKAIEFYCGYVSAENFIDYYPDIIVSTVNAALDTFQNRMGSLLFKNAVELDMMMHITAASFNIDGETLGRLRGKCVNEVKRINGKIKFDDAYQFQNGE